MLDVHSLYILEQELRSGQFETTYRCMERATGLRYACRSVSKQRLLRPADVEGVRREVAVMQHLRAQPNIAEFRAAFEDADSVHLVMELCSGGELLDRVAARGSYSERQAAAACRDILTVVHVCHCMGIMHRDLRPENFLLASSAEDAPLKAVHFGLSIFIEPGKVYKDIVGSAIYVAPEVLHRNYGREIDVWSAGVILYILLCGSPPFWVETEKGIFDAILVGQVDFYTSPWPAISESAKDLIRQMLNRDPKKRITAVQALEHPWLKEGAASHGPMDGAAILKAKQFKETNKLKQLAPKSTAEKISPEEIEGLKQMFRNMDTDKSGKITHEELRIGLASKISEAEVQKLMEAVDVDKSGNVDYTEFLATMMNKHKVKKEEDLLLPFQHFDKDNNGHATHGEKDGTRVIETSKSSGMKNENKEAEPELDKPENANVIMEEVPSSQAEFEKKLEEELRKKLLGQKLAGGTGVSISGNNEQHVLQDNNMHDTGDDGGLGKTEKEVNNYEYQDKNHGGIADITDDKIKGGTGVSISGNNEQHVLQDNNMHDTGDDGGLGKTEKEVNNYEYQDKNHGG
ncbi:hypothetical protein QYE76_029336 [Lolium multiflorum]|uniref:Uncharacterized protein n=1 Tax=Lolium multiflorum TaxID=4521 RepID=A0AAD8QMM9_LOLMU|nr:hypothetical protein QYE76_029336 [Lolium multiflorum]